MYCIRQAIGRHIIPELINNKLYKRGIDSVGYIICVYIIKCIFRDIVYFEIENYTIINYIGLIY